MLRSRPTGTPTLRRRAAASCCWARVVWLPFLCVFLLTSVPPSPAAPIPRALLFPGLLFLAPFPGTGTKHLSVPRRRGIRKLHQLPDLVFQLQARGTGEELEALVIVLAALGLVRARRVPDQLIGDETERQGMLERLPSGRHRRRHLGPERLHRFGPIGNRPSLAQVTPPGGLHQHRLDVNGHGTEPERLAGAGAD